MSLADEFMERFRGLSRAYGCYIIEQHEAEKKTGRAYTKQEQLTPAHWKQHLSGEMGLGVTPIDDNGDSYFGAIDIDIYDGLNVDKLEEQVEKLGLPLVICKTKSGGVHLYLFCRTAIPAKIVRESLMKWAIALGHPKVEIFPKQIRLASVHDTGNWINMPYFGDTRRAYANGDLLTPEQFLKHAESKQITKIQLGKIIIEESNDLSECPPCLQVLANVGFPKGSRNNGLFNLGVFCRKAYSDTWETQLEKYNQKYLKPPLPAAEVKGVIDSLKRKTYAYKCTDLPIVDVCNKQICLTRKHGVGGEGVGIMLNGLTKICTNPPSWIVDVNGVRIPLASTRMLTEQRNFRDICVNSINKLPNRVKGHEWDEMINAILEKVEIIDAPEDAGTEGQFVVVIEQFLTETPPARTKAEVLMGKPYHEKGRSYFRSTDMMKFLDREKIRITVQESWAYLRRLDAQNHGFKMKGKFVRLWSIKSFERQDEDFDQPPNIGM